jgi:hypothetical protein
MPPAGLRPYDPDLASGGQGFPPWTRALRDAGTRPSAAHRRRPDRARRVHAVRPVGRSAWTPRPRPGWAEPARRDALTDK